jgi:hypothetical protein
MRCKLANCHRCMQNQPCTAPNCRNNSLRGNVLCADNQPLHCTVHCPAYTEPQILGPNTVALSYRLLRPRFMPTTTRNPEHLPHTYGSCCMAGTAVPAIAAAAASPRRISTSPRGSSRTPAPAVCRLGDSGPVLGALTKPRQVGAPQLQRSLSSEANR